MGEVNIDGMVLDVNDEIIGYADFGHGTLKNKSGSHFCTVQSDGTVLDRNELNRGRLKNFTYHKMKIFASYVFFFDGKLIEDALPTKLTSEGAELNQAAPAAASTKPAAVAPSSGGVDSASISNFTGEEDSMTKEEARLLKHVKGAKAAASAPTSASSASKPAATSHASSQPATSKPVSQPTQAAAPAKPVSAAAPVSHSTSSSSHTSSGTSHSEAPLDERGLVADSDEKARREMERMNRLMGGPISSTSSAAHSTSNAVSQHDVMAEKYPVPKRPEVKSKYEVELWTEVNKARRAPEGLIASLEAMRPHFSGNTYHYPGTHTTRVSKEGASAIDNAIAFLKQQKPLESVALSDGLSLSCKDLVALASSTTNFDSLETDDQGNARFTRYGKWSGKLLQNLALGNLSPAEIVLSWIVDDGNASRDHRQSLFNPDIHFVGIASGPHIQFGRTIVACFTSKYSESAESSHDHQQQHSTAATSSAATGAQESANDGIPVVSQESEYKVGPLTDTGNKYYLDISNLGCPVNGLEVKLVENGKQLLMARTVRVNGVVKESVQRMKLPFQLVASQVQPEFHATSGILTINFMKDASAGATGTVAMEIGTFNVPAWPGNPNDKVSVQATSSTDAYVFACEPSKHATKVTVSIGSDKKLTFDMQYTFDTVVEGQPATKTVKMSSQFGLPFDVAPEQISVTDNGDKGSSVKILKNKPSGGPINQPDAVIPIQSK